MKPYGQFCPLAQASQLLCERWTLIIVRELMAGSTRFGELLKGAPLLSPTLLSARLKQLIKAGVVAPGQGSTGPTYHLTQAGRDLQPIVEGLGAWGQRWVPSTLTDEDLDASLLMWDMRRSVDADAFPRQRVVLAFDYPDAAEGVQRWWLVSEDGDIDLCLIDPGYDVDLCIRCALKTMTAVWTCKQDFDEAVRGRAIDVQGSTLLASRLRGFLRGSALARLGGAGGLMGGGHAVEADAAATPAASVLAHRRQAVAWGMPWHGSAASEPGRPSVLDQGTTRTLRRQNGKY